MTKPYDIAIVGAGIIGVAVAEMLSKRGLSVLLLDRRGIAEETSAGNAGGFAFTEILPLAAPGTFLKAPKWLFDPLGPLSVPPGYLPKIAPWLWRFFRAGMPSSYRRGIAAQTALMGLSETETDALLERTGLQHLVRPLGVLHLFESEREFSAARKTWHRLESNGIEFETLDRDGIDRRQPGLADHFRHATFAPGWRNATDPQHYARAVATKARERGLEIAVASIREMKPRDDGVLLISEDGRTFHASQAVVCAGAWSHHLAGCIGDRIPLETERGYNTTLAPDAFDIRCQLVFDGHGFVVSPLTSGVRVGGAVELAGLDRPPNFRRAETMLAKASRFLPGLKTQGGRQWMGFRPSLPDSLPAIGRSPRAPKVIYAFGHGHLGLTQSSGTARLVADMALDETPAIPLAPYAPDRF